MNSIKEKLEGLLGGFGAILFLVIRLLICVLPFVMIDSSFWLTLILLAINYFFPISSIVFWVWGLVCTIQGTQDIFAIVYYIAFAVMWLPFFISTVVSVFSKK